MTAAAHRALGVAVVLIAVASMIWAVYGPQGFWTVAWLLVMFVTVVAAALAWVTLQPRKGGER